jgi:hypothetical protein
MNDAWEPHSGSAASSLNDGNGGEKLDREFVQQTVQTSETQGGYQPLDEAAQ